MAKNNQNNDKNPVKPFVKPGEPLGFVGPMKEKGLWPPRLHNPKDGNRDGKVATPYLVIPAYSTDNGQRPQPNSVIFHSQGIWLEDLAGNPVQTPVVGGSYIINCNVINLGAYKSCASLADFYVNTPDAFLNAIATNTSLTALGHNGFSALQGQQVTVKCPKPWNPLTDADLALTIIVDAFDFCSDKLNSRFDAENDRKVGRRDLTPDLYVRDWTSSPTIHDFGLEPSINSVFYTTCDVWNRRSNSPGTFINDQPQNEDPQAGNGSSGDNFMFARISRNSDMGQETANAHFLFAEFGTGSPFSDCSLAPDPSVTFLPGEKQKIISLPWHLHPSASTHLCIAVQIYSVADPFMPPGLSGYTPGWPTTDTMVLKDNNKAQRNMTVWDGVSGTGGVKYARVFNGATYMRDMTIGLGASRASLAKVKNAMISLPGASHLQEFKSGGKIVLNGMMPGETRLLAFSYDSFTAGKGEMLTFYFNEMKDNFIVNGFAVNLISTSIDHVLADTLAFQSSVFYRMAEGMGSATAKESLEFVQHLQVSKADIKTYTNAVPKLLLMLEKSLNEMSANYGGVKDIFNLTQNLGRLAETIGTLSHAEALAAHTKILNQVDALQTIAVKSKGDEGNILFTVRLQRDLFSSEKLDASLDFKKAVLEADYFIENNSTASMAAKNYPPFVESSITAFEMVIKMFDNAILIGAFRGIEIALTLTPAELQSAHLNFLNTLALYMNNLRLTGNLKELAVY